MIESAMTHHPTDEEVAAYLSGTLPGDERKALEGHLAECRACRMQVTSARRLLRTRSQLKERVMAASLAAAAVIAVVLLVPRPAGLSTDPQRAGGPDEPGLSQELHAIMPADGDTVGRGSLRFAWRSEPDNPLYRLTITTPSGAQVWSHDTNDTTVWLPRDLRLAPGGKYLWFVDALDASGRSLTTGPRIVWIVP
jgi:hypothetical protein